MTMRSIVHQERPQQLLAFLGNRRGLLVLLDALEQRAAEGGLLVADHAVDRVPRGPQLRVEAAEAPHHRVHQAREEALLGICTRTDMMSDEKGGLRRMPVTGSNTLAPQAFVPCSETRAGKANGGLNAVGAPLAIAAWLATTCFMPSHSSRPCSCRWLIPALQAGHFAAEGGRTEGLAPVAHGSSEHPPEHVVSPLVSGLRHSDRVGRFGQFSAVRTATPCDWGHDSAADPRDSRG